MAFQENILGQVRPADTTAASVYSPASSATWIGKNLTVCNTSGSATTFRVFHSASGTTYDETTALLWEHPIAAATTVQITSLMAGNVSTGNVGVRSGAGNALTFTFYGAEIT